MPQLGCFVKRFYFIWCKMIRITLSLQECVGEGACIAGPAWWGVSTAKISIGTTTGWRVVDNINVMASTKSRSIRRAIIYGITVISIRGQFHRCPSRFVNQREKKCRWIVSIPGATAVTCTGKKRNEKQDQCPGFKNPNLYSSESDKKICTTWNSLIPLVKIRAS